MGVRNDGTGGRWSSPFVVRALALVVALAIAAAGFVAAAVALEGGSTELPVEHGLDQPGPGHDVDPVRGLVTGAGPGQGSA
ncbi:hypothetical protein GCM10027067_32900 [Pseudactinotalea suaedae]